MIETDLPITEINHQPSLQILEICTNEFKLIESKPFTQKHYNHITEYGIKVAYIKLYLLKELLGNV